jgi:hypothetical protein
LKNSFFFKTFVLGFFLLSDSYIKIFLYVVSYNFVFCILLLNKINCKYSYRSDQFCELKTKLYWSQVECRSIPIGDYFLICHLTCSIVRNKRTGKSLFNVTAALWFEKYLRIIWFALIKKRKRWSVLYNSKSSVWILRSYKVLYKCYTLLFMVIPDGSFPK